MTFIHVEPARDEGWDKDAAVRASETTRVSELLSRLLGDLARLDTLDQTGLDEYLDTEALDAVHRDPQTYHLIARAAHSLAGSCSIFGLSDMRQLALELEERAANGDAAQCLSLIARLNQRFLAVRPTLERMHAGLSQPASP